MNKTYPEVSHTTPTYPFALPTNPWWVFAVSFLEYLLCFNFYVPVVSWRDGVVGVPGGALDDPVPALSRGAPVQTVAPEDLRHSQG